MDDALAAVLPGVALGAVLALAAAWSRGAEENGLPQLGLGAAAGAAVAVGTRFGGTPWLAAPAAAVAVAILAGVLARVDARVRATTAPPMPGLAGVAVLGAFVVAADLAQQGGGVPITSTPLGGTPGIAAGVAAVVVSAVGVAAVAARPAPASRVRRWALLGGALAAASVLAAGLPGYLGDGLISVAPVPDVVGLALRVFAAALAGRDGPLDAAAAGFGLGVAEMLLRVVDPGGTWVVVPYLAAGAGGLALTLRPGGRDAGAATSPLAARR